ncbi:MAG: DUF2225 domain-containing protein [Defluviitaleaceae bacterium]|nr:DUF2225 domain-containing protein [Defluviitaleaceae bacterium]
MSQSTAKTPQEIQEELLSYLYTKTFTCPVCEREFMDFMVRRTRLRQINTDSDFRTHYHHIDPNLYEVLACNNCGYAAMYNSFSRITPRQQEMIKEKVTPNHKYIEFSMPLSAMDALNRYKMALTCVQAIEGKASQKAFLCLKMSWICADIKDEKNEKALIRHAYTNLKDAFSTEAFPLGGMDEPQVKYLIAELARRLGEFEEALRLISDVVVARGIPDSLKTRAQGLKELIREENTSKQ